MDQLITSNEPKTLTSPLGASSGIGLATVQLFLSKGAVVYGADLQPPKTPIHSSKFIFVPLDVTSWPDLCALFHRAHSERGRLDILYANAGMYSRETFLHIRQSSDGTLEEPSTQTFQVNLTALANQLALASHYMTTAQKEPSGGTIIITASSTSYQSFDAPDYVAAKHGVLGLLRGANTHIRNNHMPLRINAVAPSWTRTGLVPLSGQQFDELGIVSQPPEAVARSVALLATDEKRRGQCIYSRGGEYVEVEGPMHRAMLEQFRMEGMAEEDEREKVIEIVFGAVKERQNGLPVEPAE